DVSADLALGGGRALLTDFKAKLNRGEVSGSAVLPASESGPGSVDLTLKDVNLEGLGKGLPEMPVTLSGRVSGTIKATLAAAAPGKPRAVNADVELDAPDLTVQGIPTRRVKGSVSYHKGAGTYNLVG